MTVTYLVLLTVSYLVSMAHTDLVSMTIPDPVPVVRTAACLWPVRSGQEGRHHLVRGETAPSEGGVTALWD